MCIFLCCFLPCWSIYCCCTATSRKLAEYQDNDKTIRLEQNQDFMIRRRKYLQGRVDVFDSKCKSYLKHIYNNIPILALCKNDRAHILSKLENSLILFTLTAYTLCGSVYLQLDEDWGTGEDFRPLLSNSISPSLTKILLVSLPSIMLNKFLTYICILDEKCQIQKDSMWCRGCATLFTSCIKWMFFIPFGIIWFLVMLTFTIWLQSVECFIFNWLFYGFLLPIFSSITLLSFTFWLKWRWVEKKNSCVENILMMLLFATPSSSENFEVRDRFQSVSDVIELESANKNENLCETGGEPVPLKRHPSNALEKI